MTTRKDVRKSFEAVLETTAHDVRQLKFFGNKVQFLEYRAYEPAWQPRVFWMTFREAEKYLDALVGFSEAMGSE